MSVEHDNMILNPFSRLFEHIKEAQTTLVLVTRNPLKVVDSTVHTLTSAMTRVNRQLLPLGNSATLQHSVFNMLNEHTLRMVPLEMEAIDDDEEEEENLVNSTRDVKVVMSNPVRMNNRNLRSVQEESIEGSDEETTTDHPKEPLPAPPTHEPHKEENNPVANSVSDRGAVIPSSPYQDGTIQSKLLNNLYMNGTLNEDTDVIENFRVIYRNMDREGNYQPLASIFDLSEDNSSVRLKMKRMIKHLRGDPDNDLRRDGGD